MRETVQMGTSIVWVFFFLLSPPKLCHRFRRRSTPQRWNRKETITCRVGLNASHSPLLSANQRNVNLDPFPLRPSELLDPLAVHQSLSIQLTHTTSHCCCGCSGTLPQQPTSSFAIAAYDPISIFTNFQRPLPKPCVRPRDSRFFSPLCSQRTFPFCRSIDRLISTVEKKTPLASIRANFTFSTFLF